MRGSGSAEWQQFQLSGSNGELHCPTRFPSKPDRENVWPVIRFSRGAEEVNRGAIHPAFSAFKLFGDEIVEQRGVGLAF